MSATRCQSEHVEHGCFLISLQLRCSWCRKIKYVRIWSDTCYLWVFDLQFDMLASDTSSFPKPQQAIERNRAWGKALGSVSLIFPTSEFCLLTLTYRMLPLLYCQDWHPWTQIAADMDASQQDGDGRRDHASFEAWSHCHGLAGWWQDGETWGNDNDTVDSDLWCNKM